MKKAKLSTLLICALLFVSIAMTACGAKQLDNFSDTSETVELGIIYTVSNPKIEDEEGNMYEPEYTVKKKDGSAVTVNLGTFEVTSINGYVINYNVNIGKKKYAKVHTLNVVDTQGPNIKVGTAAVGLEANEYRLPLVTFEDASGAVTNTTIELYFGSEKITLAPTSDGKSYKFTPETAGEYTLNISARDSSGNSSAKQIPIYINEEKPENALTAFTYDAEELKNVKRSGITGGDKNTGSLQDWEFNFEGRLGVAWQTAGSTKDFNIEFALTKAEVLDLIEDKDYIGFWVYLDQENAQELVMHNFKFNVAGGGTSVPGRTWTCVYISLEDIYSQMDFWGATINEDVEVDGKTVSQLKPRAALEDIFAGFNSTSGNGYGVTYFEGLPADVKVYVDEVLVATKSDLSLSVDKNEIIIGGSFNYTITNPESEQYYVSVTAPDGSNVTPSTGTSVTAAKTGEYIVELRSANGFDIFREIVNVKPVYEIVQDEEITTVVAGRTVSVSTASLLDNNDASKVMAADIAVTFNGAPITLGGDNKFLAQNPGIYTVTYSCTHNSKDYSLVKTFEVLTDKVVLSTFDSIDGGNELGNIHLGSSDTYGSYTTEAVAGRTGIAWMKGIKWQPESGEDPAKIVLGNLYRVQAKPSALSLDDASAFLDAADGDAYLSLWVYIDSDDSPEMAMWDTYYGYMKADGTIGSGTVIPTKQWVKVFISAETIEAKSQWITGGNYDFKTIITSQMYRTDSVGMLLFELMGVADGTLVYFDELAIEAISLVEMETDKDIYYLSETVTVTVENPAKETHAINVKDPDGTITALGSTLSFTPSKTGTYEIILTVEGRVNSVIKSIKVANPIGFEDVTIGNAIVGRTVAIPSTDLMNNLTDVAVVENVKATVTLNGNAVTLGEDGSFLATEIGTYTVTYSASYEGEDYELVKTFKVLADKVILSTFDSAEGGNELGNAFYGVADSGAYVDGEFNGRSGVAWMKGVGAWAEAGNKYRIQAKPTSLSVENAAAFIDAAGKDAYVSFWVYIDSTNEVEAIMWNTYYGHMNADGTIGSGTKIPTKQWVKIFISADDIEKSTPWSMGAQYDFKTAITAHMYRPDNLGLLFFDLSGADNGTKVYFDEFAIEAFSLAEMAIDKDSYAFGEKATISITNPANESYVVKVKKPDGTYETLTSTVADSNEYEFTFAKPGIHEIILSVTGRIGSEVQRIAIADPFGFEDVTIGNAIVGRTVTIPSTDLMNNITNVAVVENVKATVTLNGNAVTLGEDGSFLATEIGTYTVTYSASYEGEDYELVKTFKVFANTLLFADFASEATSETVARTFHDATGGYETGTVGAVNGRTGVAWLTPTADWTGYAFSFKNIATLSMDDLVAYFNAGIDYISIWLYVDQDGASTAKVGTTSLAIADENGIIEGATQIPGRTWTKVIIPASVLAENYAWVVGSGTGTLADMFSGQIGGGVGVKMFGISGLEATTVKVYFDSITLESYNPLSLGYTDKNYFSGDSVTFEVENALNAQYLIRYKAPGASTYAALSGLTLTDLVAGEYEVVLSISGKADRKYLTLDVLAKYTLTASDAKDGIIGKSYTVSAAQVTNNFTETGVTDAEVDVEISLNGSLVTTIAASGSFIPLATGTYTAKYIFEGDETEYTVEKTFKVLTDKVILSTFDSAEGGNELGNAFYGVADWGAYVDGEFNGRSGVAWMKGLGSYWAETGNKYRIQSKVSSETLSEFLGAVGTDAYVTVWVYIDSDVKVNAVLSGMDASYGYLNADGSIGTGEYLPAKQWVKLFISASDVVSKSVWIAGDVYDFKKIIMSQSYHPANCGMLTFELAKLNDSDTLPAGTKVYFDEFAIEAFSNVGMDLDKDTCKIGDEVTISVDNPANKNYKLTLIDPDNNATVLSALKFKPALDGTYKVLLTIDNRIASVVKTISVTSDDKIIASPFDGAAGTADELGNVVMTGSYDNGNYVSEFGGRENVAWMKGISGNLFRIQSKVASAAMEQFIDAAGTDAYVTMWVYIDSQDQVNATMGGTNYGYLNADGTKGTSEYLPTQQWIKIFIGADVVATKGVWICYVEQTFKQLIMVQSYHPGNVGMPFFELTGASGTKVYFDDFAIERKSPVAVATDKASYELGEEVQLTVTNEYNHVYTIEVTDPDFRAVTVGDDLKFIAAEAGTYRIKVKINGRIDSVITKTFAVTSDNKLILSAFDGSPNTADELGNVCLAGYTYGNYVSGEFEGRTGVAWMKGISGTQFRIQAKASSVSLADAGTFLDEVDNNALVSLWVYIDSDSAVQMIMQNVTFGFYNADGTVGTGTNIPTKRWVKVFVTAETMEAKAEWISGVASLTFKDLITAQMYRADNVGMLFFELIGDANATVYFDNFAIEANIQ